MKELIDMLNKALSMEHMAAIQYYTHAEQINGPESDPLMARLQEQAGDEQEHAKKVRSLLSDYLKVVPSADFVPFKPASSYTEVVNMNIASEKEAVDQYRLILEKINSMKEELGYTFETLRFDIDEILREEQEHLIQLERIFEDDDQVEVQKI
jgi:bacterioferritin (cytochrome b1)